jgi:uncharacterized protein Veg
MLDYEFTLPKYVITRTRFVGYKRYNKKSGFISSTHNSLFIIQHTDGIRADQEGDGKK